MKIKNELMNNVKRVTSGLVIASVLFTSCSKENNLVTSEVSLPKIDIDVKAKTPAEVITKLTAEQKEIVDQMNIKAVEYQKNNAGESRFLEIDWEKVGEVAYADAEGAKEGSSGESSEVAAAVGALTGAILGSIDEANCSVGGNGPIADQSGEIFGKAALAVNSTLNNQEECNPYIQLAIDHNTSMGIIDKNKEALMENGVYSIEKLVAFQKELITEFDKERIADSEGVGSRSASCSESIIYNEANVEEVISRHMDKMNKLHEVIQKGTFKTPEGIDDYLWNSYYNGEKTAFEYVIIRLQTSLMRSSSSPEEFASISRLLDSILIDYYEDNAERKGLLIQSTIARSSTLYWATVLEMLSE